jgi:hypothetical protein
MQFICFSPKSNPEWSGLSALNVFSSKASKESITGVNISDWHVYTIIWEPGNATFFIDGKLVASFDQVTDQSMHPYAAISNTKFSGGEFGVLSNWGYDDISFDEHVEIDYVHLFGIPETVTLSILSILGLILLPPLGRRAHTG